VPGLFLFALGQAHPGNAAVSWSAALRAALVVEHREPGTGNWAMRISNIEQGMSKSEVKGTEKSTWMVRMDRIR